MCRSITGRHLRGGRPCRPPLREFPHALPPGRVGAERSVKGDRRTMLEQTATRQWALQATELDDSRFDPLLSALIVLTKHFDRPMSRAALISGLPTSGARMSPPLFVDRKSGVYGKGVAVSVDLCGGRLLHKNNK